MTDTNRQNLKEQVRIAIKQRARIEKIHTELESLINQEVETLGLIDSAISGEHEPILVRLGKKIYHVAQSLTSNRAEPVSIREARMVA